MYKSLLIIPNSSLVEALIPIFKNYTILIRRITWNSSHLSMPSSIKPQVRASRNWRQRKECDVSFALDHIYLFVQDIDFDPEPSIMCFCSWPWLYVSDVKLLTDGSVMVSCYTLEKIIFVSVHKKNSICVWERRDGGVPCNSIEDILIVSLIQNI